MLEFQVQSRLNEVTKDDNVTGEFLENLTAVAFDESSKGQDHECACALHPSGLIVSKIRKMSATIRMIIGLSLQV